MNTSEYLEIKRTDIVKYEKEINPFFETVSWVINPSVAKRITEEQSFSAYASASARNMGIQANKMSLSVAKVMTEKFKFPVIPPYANQCLNIIKEALCVGYYIMDKYTEASGLKRLYDLRHSMQQSKSDLSTNELDELNKLEATAMVIFVYTTANYVVYSTSQIAADSRTGININIGEIPEIVTTNEVDAVKAMLYYYGTYIKEANNIDTDLQVLHFTELYFRSIVDRMLLVKDSLVKTDYFENNAFLLEASDFTLTGFKPVEVNAFVKVVEVPEREFEDIYGNHRMKLLIKQISQFCCTYNFTVGKNPILELVKNPPKRILGEGMPGTGKTEIGRATSTEMDRICKFRDVPFRTILFPKNLKDKMVGGTEQKAQTFFNQFKQTDKIMLGVFDDCETDFKQRSADRFDGSDGIVQIYLTEAQGMTTKEVFNFIWLFLTNNPGLMDSAVLSRKDVKQGINGGETPHDFTDMITGWKRGLSSNKGLNAYIDLKDGPHYKPFSDQVMTFESLMERTKDYSPTSQEVKDCLDIAQKKYEPTYDEFFGEFFYQLWLRNNKFTFREMANIQKQVDVRRLNFLYPEEWMYKDGQPDVFFGLKGQEGYDRQVAMLNELMISNLGGQTMSEILLIESLVHADNFFRIHASEGEKKAQAYADDMRARARANEILSAGQDLFKSNK
ncbi:AAA family ATPase [Patescibacteria group bacterium]|nr:AAA family ATPase [Patescibacteria group bacterium]